MPITAMSKPKSQETIESQPLPDGSGLLFDPATATAYPITESAMRIWQLCDGQHDVASILDDLEAHYEVERQALERDALKFLADVAEKQEGCIVWPEVTLDIEDRICGAVAAHDDAWAFSPAYRMGVDYSAR